MIETQPGGQEQLTTVRVNLREEGVKQRNYHTLVQSIDRAGDAGLSAAFIPGYRI